MKYGIVSDIHGNLKALSDCLDALTPQADEIVCLGDICQVGRKSDACVRLVQRTCRRAVCGHADEEEMKSPSGRLSAPAVKYLRGLPRCFEIGDFLFIHDNPVPRSWTGRGIWEHGSYIASPRLAAEVFAECNAPYIVVGHAHIPYMMTVDQDFPLCGEIHRVTLTPGMRAVLCPGAVGEAPEGIATAYCALLDADEKTFTAIPVATKLLP